MGCNKIQAKVAYKGLKCLKTHFHHYNYHHKMNVNVGCGRNENGSEKLQKWQNGMMLVDPLN